VITLSNAFLHKELSNINPAFHIFAPYHEPLILEDYIKWLELGHRTLPKKTKIFLNIKSKEMVNKYHLFHGRDVFYAYFTNVPLIISDNLMMPLLGPQTVPHMSLPLLAFMGVKEILLLGCDHNVLKDYKKNINHFFPVGHDPRSNASDFAAWPGIIESHQNSCNVFLIYLKYIKMLKGKNVKLINLSDDSWLDFIPLLSYFDII